MIRLFRIALVALSVGVIAWPLSAAAEGITISKNNPYKSFNISGINYGSMQWEREHGNQNAVPSRSGRGWRHRR